jgi:hypothetical protein
MSNNPLAEIFGFPSNSFLEQAERYRRNKLCPYNNKVTNCTKDKANDPLGVCSIYHKNSPVITCPVRFRQDWLIAENAANFFFRNQANWTSLTEVRRKDANGQSAGNIDVVMVSCDDRGRVVDFGAVEVQAVYISGKVQPQLLGQIALHPTAFQRSTEPCLINVDDLISSKEIAILMTNLRYLRRPFISTQFLKTSENRIHEGYGDSQ